MTTKGKITKSYGYRGAPPEVRQERNIFHFIDGAYMLWQDVGDYITSVPKKEREAIKRKWG